MKRRTGIIFFILLLTSTLSFAAPTQVNLVSIEYPPYYGPSLPKGGFLTEIIRVAFFKENYKIKVKFYPWARAYLIAKNGKVDGIYTFGSKTPERRRLFAYSDPISPLVWGFFQKKGSNISYRNLRDLRPYVIGLVRGYKFPIEFEKYMPVLKKELVNSDLQNFKKLALERIDLTFVDKTNGLYLIQTKLKKQKDVFEWIDPPVAIEPQWMGFPRKSKNYQKVQNAFNTGLKKIKADGTYDRIIKHFGF